MALPLDEKQRFFGFRAFAPPRLVTGFSEASPPPQRVSHVVLEDIGGTLHRVAPERRSPEFKPYRFLVLSSTDYTKLHGEEGWLPKSVILRINEIGERIHDIPPGVIRAVRLFTGDGKEHLLTTRARTPEDKQLIVLLTVC